MPELINNIDNDIFTGKTVDDAILTALSKLEITKDEASIEILEEGSKGFLGLGAKPAKIKVVENFNPEKIARKFIEQICKDINVDVTFSCELSDKKLFIELLGDDAPVFIGKRGVTLDSLQYLTSLVVNVGEVPFINVVIDTNGYRKKRKQALEKLAHNMAKKSKATKKKIVLEPMSSNERRVIHFALQNDKYVFTSSEGEEPYRKVSIVPKSRKPKPKKTIETTELL